MSEDSETNESQASGSIYQGDELTTAVQGAIDDWVSEEDIPVRRDGDEVVADEDELVENISIMVAIAVDEAAD
jgi:hypothetical protein